LNSADRATRFQKCHPPTHYAKERTMIAMSMIGFGIGGIAAVDDADAFVH
jgi:hypothetical protein